MDRHHPRIVWTGSALTPSEAVLRAAVSMIERPGDARANLSWFQNERHAPQSAAPSPSCPNANFRESGSMTAQTPSDGRAPLDHGGEIEFALGTVPAQPVGTVSLPRHAQPGIHEYTAQTLAGG